LDKPLSGKSATNKTQNKEHDKEQKMAKGTRRKHSAAFKAKVALTAVIGDSVNGNKKVYQFWQFKSVPPM
jgi:hypothetical protein